MKRAASRLSPVCWHKDEGFGQQVAVGYGGCRQTCDVHQLVSSKAAGRRVRRRIPLQRPICAMTSRGV